MMDEWVKEIEFFLGRELDGEEAIAFTVFYNYGLTPKQAIHEMMNLMGGTA